MADFADDDDSIGFRDSVIRATGAFPMVPPTPPPKPLHCWLLPGEEIQVEEPNVGFLSPVGKLLGKLTITNYQLRFESTANATVAGKRLEKKVCRVYVPLGAIARVEKVGHLNVSRGEDAYGLDITCKDMRTLKFSSRQENHSRRPLFDCLQKFAFPARTKFFAFHFKPKYPRDGWTIYDTVAEFKRQGAPNDLWALSNINSRYDFADTYPAMLAVPAAALDASSGKGEEFLWSVAKFRSRARLPVLSWLHAETQVSLCRSAQPLVGMTAKKSSDDEQMLQLIIDTNARSDKLCIVDARPEVNAKVNKARGGGYENEDSYERCQLIFMDLQNIHVMRESLRKLRDICFPRVDDRTWFSDLHETHWLHHIKSILLGAARIADKIETQKTSILVHCSDGWDRTAQLTSLAMLMLDPYYRTLTGFEALIEKEWCSFGHKFAHRIGHGDDKFNDSERSPTFLQFIDAVWQLTQQFPTAFEFNTILLVTILDELFSCRFGTFLYNCERERRTEQLRERTPSLWSMVNSDAGTYVNPLYNEATADDVLIPACTMRRIRLWTDYYLRYNPAVNSNQRMEDEIRMQRRLVARRDELQAEAERLKSEQRHARPLPAVPANAPADNSPTHRQTSV